MHRLWVYLGLLLFSLFGDLTEPTGPSLRALNLASLALPPRVVCILGRQLAAVCCLLSLHQFLLHLLMDASGPTVRLLEHIDIILVEALYP